MTHNENLLFMAREYAALGWHMIPLFGVNEDLSCACEKPECSDTGKHPVTARGVKDATVDLKKLEDWFTVDAPRNLGIVAGAISGLTIIDIDMGEGKVGAQTWSELCRENGEPPTLLAVTGSGGMHVFFQYNSALKTSSNTLGKHVDCRNDNGYVVAPPSRHKSGGVYAWDNWGHALAALPAHLSRKKEGRGRPRKDDLLRGRYTIEQVKLMLEHVPADDRDLWRHIGIILGREFKRADEAWTVYNEWAATWGGAKGRGHDANMHDCFYNKSQESSAAELSMGTLIKAAIENGWVPRKGDVSFDQFVYDHESNGYIYRPSGAIWVAKSVDAACGDHNNNGTLIKASVWIQQHARVTTTTCTPAIKGDVLQGYDCRDGALFESPGGAVYNRYRPPTIELGDASMAGRFEEHVRKVMPREEDADQFLDYMAHRVQKPEEKPRFALLIVGDQGVGKDTSVDFCCPALGDWNVANISPMAVEDKFNDYATKTLVRINEAANSADMSKWVFNERIKVLIAGNPDACVINPKYGRMYTVRLYCGVIITTNHLYGSIHIPADDRRYDVIQCATLEEMGLADETARRDYFTSLYEWFNYKDGDKHVAAFLHARDLSEFLAALGQRKTAAHMEIVQHGMVSDEWLRDIVDQTGNAVILRGDWIQDRGIGMGMVKGDVRAKMVHGLSRLGYDKLPNPTFKDGRWKLNNVLCTLYRHRDHRPSPEPDWKTVLTLASEDKGWWSYDKEQNAYVYHKSKE